MCQKPFRERHQSPGKVPNVKLIIELIIDYRLLIKKGIYIALSYVGTDLKGRIVYNGMHCDISRSTEIYVNFNTNIYIYR